MSQALAKAANLVLMGFDAQPLVAPGPAPERYSGNGEERQDFDPIWDGKVQAYVQWDPTEKRWMRYDDTFGDWLPVEQE